MPEEEKKVKEPTTDEKLNAILGLLGGIDERLTKVEEFKKTVTVEDPVMLKVGDIEKPLPDDIKPMGVVEEKKIEYPIPNEFIQAKDEILGKEFGMDLVPSVGSPAFTINIMVPRDISNMSQAEWEVKKVDIRSKVLTYSQGIAGLNEWLLLVANNLKTTKTGPVSFSIGKTAPAEGVPAVAPPSVTGQGISGDMLKL